MIDLYETFKSYRVSGDYCEVCFNFDGEQRYLVDGVTICEPCLIDNGKWSEFPELVDIVDTYNEGESYDTREDFEREEYLERKYGVRE